MSWHTRRNLDVPGRGVRLLRSDDNEAVTLALPLTLAQAHSTWCMRVSQHLAVAVTRRGRARRSRIFCNAPAVWGPFWGQLKFLSQFHTSDIKSLGKESESSSGTICSQIFNNAGDRRKNGPQSASATQNCYTIRGTNRPQTLGNPPQMVVRAATQSPCPAVRGPAAAGLIAPDSKS